MNNPIKLSIQGLRKMLRCFDYNGKFASYGAWSIACGGYDLWFEIYYNGQPIIRCVAGELEIEVPDYWYSGFDKVIRTILDEYKDLRYTPCEEV